MKNRPLLKVFVLIGLVVASILVGYFQVFIPVSFDSTQAEYRFPKYIFEVWPQPGAKIGFLQYSISTFFGDGFAYPMSGEGVFVTLTPNDSLDTWNNLVHAGADAATIYIRNTKLFVDEREIPKDTFSATSGIIAISLVSENGLVESASYDGGPYWMSWAPVLLPGRHTAKIQILNQNNETREYVWDFVITLW